MKELKDQNGSMISLLAQRQRRILLYYIEHSVAAGSMYIRYQRTVSWLHCLNEERDYSLPAAKVTMFAFATRLPTQG